LGKQLLEALFRGALSTQAVRVEDSLRLHKSIAMRWFENKNVIGTKSKIGAIKIKLTQKLLQLMRRGLCNLGIKKFREFRS
jgi:hypothetical protein